YFNLIDHSVQLDRNRWRLVDQDGVEIFDRLLIAGNAGTFSLTRGGTYTITVGTDQEPSTGTYSFKLWNVPPPSQFPIAIGDTVTNGVPGSGAGNIETPGAQDIYTFTATPGEAVFFSELNAVDCISPLQWRLVDGVGTVMFDEHL